MDTMLPSSVAMMVETAIAPIFLLVAIGSIMNVMTQRLARVVDRVRALEDQLEEGEADEPRARHVLELRTLSRRMRYANWAIIQCTSAAVLISLLVAMVFLGEVTGLPLERVVVGVFVLTMACLIGGLGTFLAEVQVSMKMLKVRHELIDPPVNHD